jgi:hypothetical protein
LKRRVKRKRNGFLDFFAQLRIVPKHVGGAAEREI